MRTAQTLACCGAVGDSQAIVAETTTGEGVLEFLGPVGSFRLGVAGEFHDKDCAGLAVDEGHASGEGGGVAGAFEQHLADQLDGGGGMFENGGGGVAGLAEGVEVGDGEGGGLGCGNEVYPGFGDDAEGAFGADHHPTEVDGATVEELVEVVTTDPSHDVGVAGVNFVAVGLGDLGDAAVDLGLQSAAGELGFQLGRAEVGEAGFCAVGEDYVQFKDVVAGLAVDDGVGAAGVVADAAADGGAVGGGGVRRVLEAVRGEEGR